tara:strand:- start:359 stop:526 length:168 start_codon:yes stop_codon:yes gene_type:complete
VVFDSDQCGTINDDRRYAKQWKCNQFDGLFVVYCDRGPLFETAHITKKLILIKVF